MNKEQQEKKTIEIYTNKKKDKEISKIKQYIYFT